VFPSDSGIIHKRLGGGIREGRRIHKIRPVVLFPGPISNLDMKTLAKNSHVAYQEQMNPNETKRKPCLK